ncbi:zinc-dependent alcohol dehydrogenase [Clostridium polynesiense]|uniref:zinc-dependent alcohol dehydrogenase n=1 Tax=Clostridium polynesiense TaxID=1325933 RepID=UPI00058DDA26|nr:alcohol dehydrogenase catalytic domain-containing protein [Clostridium polynesiense]
MDKHKISVITGPREAKLFEVDIPEIKNNEVLVANKVCALCTSDYQLWMGTRDNIPYNVAFGHENAGVVVKVGADVKNVKEGDRVAFGVLGCGVCDDCRKGLNLKRCMNATSSHTAGNADGYHGPHGASQYKAVEGRKLFKVRDGVSLKHAAFLEPIATVVEGIERMRIKPNENILVVGAGTMGNLNAQVARKYGATVIVSEVSDKKLETLRKMGFKHLINSKKEDLKTRVNEILGGQQLDGIIVSVGATPVYRQVFEMAPKCCRILLFAANYPAPEWGMNIDPNLIHYNLWEIIGTYTASTFAFQQAMDLINKEDLNLDLLIDGEFDQDKLQEAFEAASTPDMFRVLLNI